MEIVTVLDGRKECAQYSRAAGEDMAGTVKPVDVWLLIEYRGRWEREAAAVFSEPVQARLRECRSRMPGMRLALIKRPHRTSGLLRVFWAFPSEADPRLYRSEISGYEALLSLDPELPGEPSHEKIVAVCTHGTHDLCCAQFGNKIYAQLQEIDSSVWQISHVGGCRFAPNVVCLPHGVVYGRVEGGDCAEVIKSYHNGEVLPQKLRGRSCYSKAVQAAEKFLRTARQIKGLDDLKLANAKEIQAGEWSVEFLSGSATRHRVSVRLQPAEAGTYKSCMAKELSPREHFEIVNSL